MTGMVSFDDFKKLELKVAEIAAVDPHPNADRLWMLRIKIGVEERTIVAGIRQHYAPEQLVGRKIVVVSNLEPATIRGVTSQGMLLAASDDQKIIILVPEKDIASGSVVK